MNLETTATLGAVKLADRVETLRSGLRAGCSCPATRVTMKPGPSGTR
jgi:hypothetical protein